MDIGIALMAGDSLPTPEHWRRIIETVNKQAQNGALWDIGNSIVEAYIQQELRYLHAVIEGDEEGFPHDD